MFRKKRRMELARPGERRRREETERESQPMTRRVFLVRSMMGMSFAALTGRLFQMQIAEGGTYQEAAEGNILRFERLKAPRGRILDRSGKPLAENRHVWTVKLVGRRLPGDKQERQRVLDTLATTLDLKQVLVLDRTLVPIGSEAAVVNALSKRIEVDASVLIARLTSPNANLELLRDELEPDEARAFKEQLADIPGVRVFNLLDYALATQGSPDVPMVVKTDVDRDTALSIAANVVYLPGVTVDDSALVRQYTAGETFSHILGYVGAISGDEYEAEVTPGGNHIYDPDDAVGRGGVEQALEKELRGEKGGRWVQVDSQGVERLELAERRREPRGGLSARLTIDRDFQIIVTEALQQGIEDANKRSLENGGETVGAGVAIAMNPQSGEILAMASLPTFDNQKFVNGISEKDYTEYIEHEFEPLLNRAISGQYTPGSTFKPLLACVGLQEGVITPDKKYTCRGNIRVPWTWDETQGNTYPCWLWDVGHGEVDIYSGIAHSCGVYFYNVGAPDSQTETGARVHYYIPGDSQPHFFEGLGVDRIERYLKEGFGFGSATGIELAGEAEGLVPTPKWLFQSDLHEYWSIGDTINLSIGQGHLLCTPLQLAAATSLIANGGILHQPRVIRDLISDDGAVARQFEPEITRDLREEQEDRPWFRPEHLEAVREGMRRTVTEGTALGYISVPDVVVAAKTGTAEFGEAVEGKYKQGHAWFSAFAPFENPEICVVVLIVGGHEGSINAGPVVNRILNAYFHQPGIREAAQSQEPDARDEQ